MFEKIDEPIEVLVKFKLKNVLPHSFKWRDKVYTIKDLNMVHKVRQGNDKIFYFSVSDETNFFRLAFYTKDLSWNLEELYYDS